MALNLDKPVKEKHVKSGQVNQKAPKSVWPFMLRGVLILLAAMVHVFLFILSIPLVFISMICGWKIKESIIAEGIRKSIRK